MCGCTPWWPSARPSWCSSSSPSTSCGASLPCTARALLFLHILDREYFRWLHLLCITGVGGWCLSKQSVDNSLHSVSFGSIPWKFHLIHKTDKSLTTQEKKQILWGEGVSLLTLIIRVSFGSYLTGNSL